ncbi:MAG: hypothetical protein ACI9Y1_000878 [Lentisphaeria bacterium]|jgi:hypothetical protein
MLQRKAFFLWLGFCLIISVLSACGGSSNNNDFGEVSDLALADLQVKSGGDLYYDGYLVEEFDPANLGPYRVEIESQDLTEITISAALKDGQQATLEVVEVAKGDDGEDFTRALVSGSDTAVEINEGENLVYVSVASTTSAAKAKYILLVTRQSSDANLAGVTLQGGSSLVTYDDDTEGNAVVFSSDVFDYKLTVDEQVCNISLSLNTLSTSRQSTITVDGEETRQFELKYFPVGRGESKTVEVVVFAGDKVESTPYTFIFKRDVGTSSELAADSTLESLEFSSGRSTESFLCEDSTVVQAVSKSTESISIVATLAAAEAKMTIGNSVLSDTGFPTTNEDNTSLWASENDLDLTSELEFSDGLLGALVEGSNYFVITVTSADGGEVRSYLINVFRPDTDEIYVETAEELQQALKNAQPNDEIIVTPGDYSGVVGAGHGEGTSGHVSAHFFSDASGTEAEPIILRAESSGVVLSGSDQSLNAVLMLQGDHWQVSGIELSGAQNALVLEGANDNLFISVLARNVGERAVVLQNGSSNNQLRSVVIDNTGLLPETRDGIAEVYGEGIVVGGGDSDAVDANNSFKNIFFGKNIANEAIDLKAKAQNTAIQSNVFITHNTVIRPVENRSVIVVGGDLTNISYNQFEHSQYAVGTETIHQLVSASSATPTPIALSVYQNNVDLDGQDISIVNASGSATVDVADNKRDAGDEGTIEYVGSGINQGFVTPSYQIQSAADASKCLARRDIDFAVGGIVDTRVIVTLVDCANESDQHWQFIHDGDGFVTIVQEGLPDNKISIASVSYPDRTISQYLEVREDKDTVFDDAYYLRWLIVNDGDDVGFVNKATRLSISEGHLYVPSISFPNDGPQTEDNLLNTESSSTAALQKFRLIDQ